jgi:glycosyltransferase involved in cell wall biosynthesis
VHGVLFVDPSTALGGAEHSLLLLLEHLDRDRFSPQLATQPGELAREARARDVTVHEVPLPQLRGQPSALGRLPRGAASLSGIVRDEGIALLHANTLRAGAYAGVAARLAHRPLLWHVRDLGIPRLQARFLAALSDAVVAVSAAVAEALPCRASVIPNGVHADHFAGDHSEDARRLRLRWGVPEGAPLVGQIARLAPWKGQRHVLAAAEHVHRELPDAWFVLAGGDVFGDAADYAGELRERVAGSDAATRVVLPGHQQEVTAALTALDLLVHASRAEPFGRILIEAAAAGVPVVAFASGGVPEIVLHEETGLLVPDGDEAALAAGILRLLREPALAHRLGERGRVRARERFAVGPLTRRLEALMEELIARG